jgi:hypothetical protein
MTCFGMSILALKREKGLNPLLGFVRNEQAALLINASRSIRSGDNGLAAR